MILPPAVTWHNLDTKTLFLLVLSVVSGISFYAVVKSRDVPICNFLAICRELILLVDFLLLVSVCYCREFSSLKYLIFY